MNQRSPPLKLLIFKVFTAGLRRCSVGEFLLLGHYFIPDGSWRYLPEFFT